MNFEGLLKSSQRLVTLASNDTKNRLFIIIACSVGKLSCSSTLMQIFFKVFDCVTHMPTQFNVFGPTSMATSFFTPRNGFSQVVSNLLLIK